MTYECELTRVQEAAGGEENGVGEAADALPAYDPPSVADIESRGRLSGDVVNDPILNPQTANWEKDPQVSPSPSCTRIPLLQGCGCCTGKVSARISR